MSAADQLLVVIDPAARRSDGESVRIAKDVLCAGAQARVCVPDTPEEFARAIGRRGARRLVVIGDDHALLRAVTLLHRERELSGTRLSLVPVGAATGLAGALGVPLGAVAAARSALEGAHRALDLLVDDSDGVVLGALRVPAVPAPRNVPAGAGAAAVMARGWWAPGLRTCRSLVRTLASPLRGPAGGGGVRTVAPAASHRVPLRLRVEADGVMLCDVDRPVGGVSVVTSQGGLAQVAVEPAGPGNRVRTSARTVTVSGPDFRYRADAVTGGPVRTRTWTVLPAAWSLTLPG